MKMSFDRLVSFLVGLGIPGLVLIVAALATGLYGGAAIVAALAALGGPLGMMGGLALLGVLVMVSKAIADYGFEAIFKAVLNGLKEKGISREEMLKTIDGYLISDDLKRQLRDYIGKFYGPEANER